MPATIAPSLTVVDLSRRFGPISLRRIRFDPEPGTATEQDVLDIHQREKRLFELVDGILVEKTIGFMESVLAAALCGRVATWVSKRNLGAVAGADGMMRLAPGLIRIPDVSFMEWDRFPNRQIQVDPIPDLVPDLAVEVLSPSNTELEMEGKLNDYFRTGTRLVWYVDPRTRTVDVYTAPDQSIRLTQADTLDGGSLLPGFRLPLRELFAELDPH
jgi:Uma2 family endonuclease